MNLQINCPACNQEFKLDKSFNTRPDLISELGEYFEIPCVHCQNNSTYHANDVKAVDSFSGNIVGSGFGVLILIGTTLFAWNQGFLTNAGLIIGGGVIAASNFSALTSNSKAFNAYKVHRTKRY